MNEKERFKEIAETAAQCATDLQELEKLAKEGGVMLHISNLYYALGYIEGLCNNKDDKTGKEVS